MFTLRSTPDGSPFRATIPARRAANSAAGPNSRTVKLSRETAKAGIPSIVASVAAETVPE